MIRRKILEKVATFTTHKDFVEDEDTDDSTSSSVDPDLVLANGSDSSEESKIAVNSIDDEDSIVDVSMKEINGGSATNGDASKSQPSEFP
jgi:ubiquitin carboxyl-terminal hydrolase 4/11/15